MYYKFEIQENGMVEPDVQSEEGVVHFDKPKRGDFQKVVPIKGDTYSYKDDIKATEWEDTHRKWNGEYWQADCDSIRLVINKVCRVCQDVTVHPDVVEESESLKEFRGKFEIGEEDTNETFEFYTGPKEGDERVSRSWAENAAEVGNFEFEEFVDEFNLDVVDDEELFKDYEESNMDEAGQVVGSADAIKE